MIVICCVRAREPKRLAMRDGKILSPISAVA